MIRRLKDWQVYTIAFLVLLVGTLAMLGLGTMLVDILR